MRVTITDAGNAVLGEVSEGRAGTWVLQVSGFPGLTSLTPQVSIDGVTWDAASVVAPDVPQTPAATITANGVYYFDVPGGVKARLLGAGTGTVVVEAVASLRA